MRDRIYIATPQPSGPEPQSPLPTANQLEAMPDELEQIHVVSGDVLTIQDSVILDTQPQACENYFLTALDTSAAFLGETDIMPVAEDLPQIPTGAAPVWALPPGSNLVFAEGEMSLGPWSTLFSPVIGSRVQESTTQCHFEDYYTPSWVKNLPWCKLRQYIISTGKILVRCDEYYRVLVTKKICVRGFGRLKKQSSAVLHRK